MKLVAASLLILAPRLVAGPAVFAAARAQEVALPVAAAETVPAAAGYQEVARVLAAAIERQLADHQLPGLSIALIDDQRVVWARGFGFADAGRELPATAETVYRVGSVSKLFTDIAIMQQVERGALDLDAPVERVLRDFAPRNPFGGAITLRQLMAHRSGLVREPPVGSYFDDSAPSLAATVRSLDGTALVHPPGTRTKYSNAGIAVVGRVLEVATGEPFAPALARAVLAPIGLTDSSFDAPPALLRRRARGLMWGFDGRRFDAPGFALGMAPAGSMDSTVLDLARFVSVLVRGGAPLLRPDSLREMWRPQFEGARFGLGFAIGELEGRRVLGHGGAIYGFATELAFLPEERLGVVVAIPVDVANAVAVRLARQALRLMTSARAGGALLELPANGPIDPLLARALDGRFVPEPASAGQGAIELAERHGGLYLLDARGWARLRRSSDGLVVDDRHTAGRALRVVSGDSIELDGISYRRTRHLSPPPPPAAFAGLIGEYGWDHNVLFVYEHEGGLNALVEWIEIAPLRALPGEGADVFAFPDTGGLYPGERIAFERDPGGRARRAIVAGIAFPRRTLAGEGADFFAITPRLPIAELRRLAAAATPPPDPADALGSDLVELVTLDPTLRLDIRYATERNFMRSAFYSQPRAFLQRDAARALVRVHRALAPLGYGLLIHDAYRPWYVTKMFWDATPDHQREFVADPSRGSRHNRGCAVDLTLYELASGHPVEMVGLYDEMSPRSYPDYFGGSSLQRYRRELLRDAMEREGFRVVDNEWWHFDYQGWERYPIGNRRFEELSPAPGRGGR